MLKKYLELVIYNNWGEEIGRSEIPFDLESGNCFCQSFSEFPRKRGIEIAFMMWHVITHEESLIP